MPEKMSEVELNAQFLEVARERDDRVREILNCGRSVYLASDEKNGAIATAIKFIRENKNQPKKGFVKIFEKWASTHKEELKSLTVEAVFLEFYEKYKGSHQDLFPDDVAKIAGQLMDWKS